LKRQAFFGSFFQRLEKMNNTKQNRNPQGIGNKNREITFNPSIPYIHYLRQFYNQPIISMHEQRLCLFKT